MSRRRKGRRKRKPNPDTGAARKQVDEETKRLEDATDRINKEHGDHNKRMAAERRVAVKQAEKDAAAAEAAGLADVIRRAAVGDKSVLAYSDAQKETVARLAQVKPDVPDTDEINIDCGHENCPERFRYGRNVDNYHTLQQFIDCSMSAGRSELEARAIWDANVAQAMERHACLINGAKTPGKLPNGLVDFDRTSAAAKPPPPEYPQYDGVEPYHEDAKTSGQYIDANKSGAYDGKEMHGWHFGRQGCGRDSCGQLSPMGSDNESHGAVVELKFCPMTCEQASCENCWDLWRRRMSKTVIDRITHCCAMMSSDSSIYRYGRAICYLPFIITFPPEMMDGMKDIDVYEQCVKEATDNLKKAGMEAFVTIDHPAKFANKPNGPYWSPHLHGVGVGWIDGRKVRQLNRYGRLLPAAEGLVGAEPAQMPESKRVRYQVYNEGITTETGRVAGHLAYLLTHNMFRDGRKNQRPAVKYYGRWGNRAIGKMSVRSNSAGAAKSMEKLLEPKVSRGVTYEVESVVMQYARLREELNLVDWRKMADKYSLLVPMNRDGLEAAIEDGSLLSAAGQESPIDDNAQSAGLIPLHDHL